MESFTLWCAYVLRGKGSSKTTPSFIKQNTAKGICNMYLSLLVLVLSLTVVKANTVYTWTGTTSSRWTDMTNWSPMAPNGGPSGCNIDVIIPVAANNPVIVSSVTIANIQVKDHAVLTLKGNLAVCRNWTGGATAYATVQGTGSVVFESDTTQIISGITQMPELYLDNPFGITMQSGAVLDLFISLDLKAGNFDAAAGRLTFKSNTTDSIAFIDNFTQGNGAGTLTGSVTVERYYDASATNNQRFLGSPVNNPSLAQFGASGTAGFVQNPQCDETRSLGTSPYGNMFAFHESNGAACALQEWEVVTSGVAQNGLGYSWLKASSGKLVLTGIPNLDSTYSITGLTNSNWSNTSIQGHTFNSGWQLISNPYLAEVALSQTETGFDNQVQVWNSYGPYANSYQPMMMGFDALVAPFQAFMVHKAAAGGVATYTIRASERTRDIGAFHLQSANELKVIATNNTNGMLDQTVVAFNTAATDSFDAQYDATKFAGPLNRHTIYTNNGSMWMARNVLHDITAVNTVPMGFEPGATATYSLAFNGLSTFDPTAYIYLEDKTTHTMHNVRNGDYTFIADSADAWNRFVLHFYPAVKIVAADAGCAYQGNIQISQAGIAYWNYILTDSNNALVLSGALNHDQPVNVNVAAGTYTLKLTDTYNYTVVKTITVNAALPPVAGFDISDNTAQTNQNITLMAMAQDALSYQWNLGDGSTASGAMLTVNYMNPGTYNVSLTVENQAGCFATSTQPIFVTSPTGISAAEDVKGPAIWSNSNIIYVDFANVPTVNANIIIYDILGRQVSNEKMTSSLLYRKQINNIQEGYFIVTVANDNQETTKKVLITNVR